ncbi:MAG: ribonuclease R, partial [Oscillospiraceae bacterium]|nr:ribonuclease R [Oscillospiraceae bacterium]
MSKKPKKAKSPLKSKPKAKAKAKAKKSFELKGEIVRMGRTHGFIREIPFKEVKEEPQEYFVSGRDLLGAVIGDVVLFERVQSRFERTEGSLQEVRVTRVLKQTKELLTGVIVADATTGELCLAPDSFGARYPLEIAKQERCPKGRALPDRRGELDENAGGIADYAAGDKVAFTLKSRGEKHHLHIAEITSVFGEAKKARVCVAAYLEEKRITTTFPTACDSEAKDCGEIIDECEIPKRVDLRDMPIFTIDGADTKDIDDAINIERVRGGYRLGVHIADVSHYVTHGSELDKEAFERGTSVYIADLVVPMLPKALSNGICSLNPDVDRLAFSCIMDVGKSGELKSFEFKKSVIRSKVQGVYSEINEILRCRKSRKRPAAELGEKYAEVKDQLVIMLELAQTLKAARAGRGSPSLESAEPKIICDDEGRCVDIIRRETGEDIVAEGIIEEFMLLANNAAARLAMEIKLPFVYRVHEQPAVEKLTRLSETLAGLGISTGELKPTAESLSNVIKVVGEQFPDKLDVINMA